MSSKAKPCNAKRTNIDGLTFDSIYESEVYEILRNKILSMENPNLRISVHHPIHFTGGKDLSRIYVNPVWKVDFVIIDISKGSAPICGIEAKGRFFPQDKFKFLLWDVFQRIPLMVVYQGIKPSSLLSNGWLTFLPTSTFRSLSLPRQINYKNETNKSRS